MDTLYGRWQIDKLQGFRQVQDETADQVVAHFESHEGPAAVTRIFRTLADNQSLKDIKDPVLAEYFQTNAKLPPWADQKKMELASHLYERNGLLTSTVLMCCSLPMCYACGNGAHILWLTGRLDLTSAKVDPMVRRVMQTAQFVLDNKTKEAYTPEGHGFASTLKVRLVHATIRYIVRKKAESKDWDVPLLGEIPDFNEIGAPINQEDLAGTLMSFGYVVIRGMEMLGVDFTEEEKDAWIHHTNVVGYILGIKEDLLPKDYNDARDLTFSVLKHQGRASIHGKELTKAITTLMAELTPGTWFDRYPIFLMSKFLNFYEDQTGLNFHEFIDLDHHSTLKDRIIFNISKLGASITDELGDHFGIAASVTERFNVRLLDAMIKYFDDGMRAKFRIPEHLRHSWGVRVENQAPQ